MIARRELFGLSAAAMASCTRSDGAYFGKAVPPRTSRLVHTLAGEIETLDPAKSTASHEFWVIPALFEGLTQYHPELPIPMAALATHYESNADFTQFRFYLRGHPAPRGIKLPVSADLSQAFLQGRRPSPESARAYWSDGVPITAHDFVYSWRRFVDPTTAAPFSYLLDLVKNGREIRSGERPPQDLGVNAPDEFTFAVDLRSSTSYFLEYITSYLYSAVPRHALESARRLDADGGWTHPSRIVTSGAFTLAEYRPFERIVLIRNPRYYDASMVRLQELTFLPVPDGTVMMNLYRAGEAAVTPGLVGVPPLLTPVLHDKKDYHSRPAFGTVCPCISTRRAPFDNVLLRYALNMATDKRVIADFYGPGFLPARSLIAPCAGYESPHTLEIDIDGRAYDVLALNVEGARSLLSKAGFTQKLGHDGVSLEVPYHFPISPDTLPKAQILQQQWTRNLNIGVKLIPREFNVHIRMLLELDYAGVADNWVFPTYVDPNGFFDQFPANASGNPSGWSDTTYESELIAANGVLSRSERMKKLGECEKRLLAAMPILPFYHAGLGYLCKPFVRGIATHMLDVRAFKYVWIDANWRPR